MAKEILSITKMEPDGSIIHLSDGKRYLVQQDYHPTAKAWSAGRLVVVKSHGHSPNVFELRVGSKSSDFVLAAAFK